MAISTRTKSRDVLNTDLHVLPLSQESKHEFARQLWNYSLPVENVQPQCFDAYFRYYEEQCKTAVCDNLEDTKSHRQIVNIARSLLPSATNTPGGQPLLDPGQFDDGEKYWLLFAVRIYTMVDVGGLRQGFTFGQIPRAWTSGSLEDFFKSTFPNKRELADDVKLERLFNARNIDRIAGIRIIWTTNLADHLELEDDDTSVKLFSHASFLELHRSCKIFPARFVDETLRTLALLLPPGDKKSTAWFRKEQKRCPIDWLIDEKAITCPVLKKKERQIENFEFWHDRLVMLKQAFDEADPKSMRQWWADRRKPVQWLNFWIAIALLLALTVIFGVIQSIEGGFQAYKAYYPSP